MLGVMIKRSVGLILFALCLRGITAQTAPVSQPTFYTPPDKSEIEEYFGVNCGYAISFPGHPIVGNFPEGCTSVYLQRKGSVYEFRRLGFSPADFWKHSRAQIWEDLKKSKSNRNFRLVDEKELTLNGLEGKEFRHSDGAGLRWTRAWFAKDYLYIIYIEIPYWQTMAKSRPGEAVAFQAEGQRFFGSFRLLEK